MKTIELKPKLLLFAARTFVMFFALNYLAKHCAYGFSIIHDPDFWLILRARAIEALVFSLLASILMAIPFFRGSLDIRLDGTTLHAPVWERWKGWKPMAVDLSDISVSRTLRDRIRGTLLVINNGKNLHISSCLYATGAIPKLLDVIEKRRDT